jgi:trehalose-6-phosphate synthase
MPFEERKQGHSRMFAHLMRNDVDRWAELFLSALAKALQRPGFLSSGERLPLDLCQCIAD